MDTGSPIRIPVGAETLGRIMNVIGKFQKCVLVASQYYDSKIIYLPCSWYRPGLNIALSCDIIKILLIVNTL